MDREFWLDRWRNRQIAFHKDHYNPHLVKHWDLTMTSKDGGIFVPLCGKSLDMLFFVDRGRPVVGVELSEQAIQEFFMDNKIEFHQDQNCYTSEMVKLYCEDFFALGPEHVRGVTAIYDRASLIALPEDLRKRYAEKMNTLFTKGTEYFLLANEFDNTLVGPPFGISDKMIHDYFEKSWDIHLFFEENERPEDIDVHPGKVHKKINRGYYLKHK